jgi:hypothetical protein
VPLDDELVDVCCVERGEGLQGEVVDLSRCRDRSTYADTATIPTRGGTGQVAGGERLELVWIVPAV